MDIISGKKVYWKNKYIYEADFVTFQPKQEKKSTEVSDREEGTSLLIKSRKMGVWSEEETKNVKLFLFLR